MAATVFITGASGYVGRHVAAEFLQRGYSVQGLARCDRSSRFLEGRGVLPVRGDLDRPDTYQVAASRADVIVHAGFSYSSEGEERADIDRIATAALLDFAVAGGRTRTLIYTSSVFRYRPGSDGEYATELNAVPRDPGDWRHAVGEQVLAASTPSLTTAVIRLGWVFGSDGGTLGQAICTLAGRSFPDAMGRNRVPLVDVFDLARLYAEVPNGAGGVFHGCAGRPATVADLSAAATALRRDRPAAGGAAEAHFTSIFERDTPAVSIHQPADEDYVERLVAALRAGKT